MVKSLNISIAFGGGLLRSHDRTLKHWIKLKNQLIDLGHSVSFHGHYWDFCKLDKNWLPHLTSVEATSDSDIEDWASIDVVQRTHDARLETAVYHYGQHFSGLFALHQVNDADLVLRARWDSQPAYQNLYLLQHLTKYNSPYAFTENVFNRGNLKTHDVSFMFNRAALGQIKKNSPYDLITLVSKKFYIDRNVPVNLSAHDLWDDIMRINKIKRVNVAPISAKIIR